MRIRGRILRASDLAERRVLLAIGVDPVAGLRVPRDQNPFAVARTIKRLARDNDDIRFLKMVAAKTRTYEPKPSPGVDHTDLVDAAE